MISASDEINLLIRIWFVSVVPMEGLVKTISESMLPIDPKMLSTILMGPLNQYAKFLAFPVIKMNRLFQAWIISLWLHAG